MRRSTRQIKALKSYSPSLYYLLLTNSGESECYDEALQVKIKDKWELAMDNEIASLMENQMCDLIELSESKQALYNKWVYCLKEEHDRTKRYKTRLVVKEF